MVVKYCVLEHYTIRKMTMNNHSNDLTSSYHHDLTKVLKRKRRQKQWMTIVMIMLMIYFYIRTLITKVSPLMRSEPNDPSLLLPNLKFDLPIQSYRNQTYEFHANDKISERYYVDDPRIKYDMNFISTYQSPVRMYGSHRVEDSLKRLPIWLQNYFKWHSKQRQNPSSNETKYLVITCFRGDDYCGGTSDRLRPLPYYLLVANATQRVLLIKWTKPFDLGEFLMPARDIDWRTPLEGFDDLIEESNGKNGICQSKIKGFFGGLCSAFVEDRTGIESCHNFIVDRLRREDDTFLIFDLVRKSHEQINQCNMLFQKFSYEEEFPALNKWDFPEMFGYIFRVMFQPTPVIGNNIQRSMEKMNINDGEYISVHVRSKYPSDRILQKNDHTHVDKSGGLSFYGEIRDHLIDVADNAIRCAQKLSPTLPLYFASDSHSLTKFVLNENKYSSSKCYEYLMYVRICSLTKNSIKRNCWYR